jgi:spoIIIJ-associated protein
MPKSIISEGKTTQEAIEKGLAQIRLSKDKVDIKVLEAEDKRSFFSILTPRVVKVEITVKEGVEIKEAAKEQKIDSKIKETSSKEERVIKSEDEDVKLVIEKINQFLEEFLSALPTKEVKHDVRIKDNYICVEITGERLNYLIGYRGETLNAIQVILSSIASKYSKEKLRVLLDIENYRAKREKALEDLSEKIAKTVAKTRKAITLEPMTAYERKVIHSKLQSNAHVKTYSTGVEPYRKIVVTPK